MTNPNFLKFLSILSIILLIGLPNTTGLDLDDSCDSSSRYPTSSNPIDYDSYTKCDPRQGLFCHPQYSKCACYVVDSEYDTYYDTCRGKIGFPCKASPTFTISCGENAICEESTGFCRCEEDYVSDPNDKFNCNSGFSVVPAAMSIPLVVMSFMFNFSFEIL